MAKGGGGSQLAQLKSTVKSSGINDRRQQSNSAKKRKRGQASNERDEGAARREALARINSDSKFNPFEEKVTKLKHDVLGRKVKGAVGRPALAKQGGLAQRKATLLPEYQNRNKTSTFIDRRFGETDSSLTAEEKMLERFTREKQRQAKGKKAALFNLNDDDADRQEEELTHFGRSLSGMGNLPELSMMDRDDGQIDGDTTRTEHFGGFEADTADPDRPKSKADVMREVMAKSKMHKMERQQMRDADDELRAQLDDELGDIRGLLMAGSSRPKGEEEASDALPSAPRPKPAGSDYDAFVRELAFERRAKPQDRLKTEAELAEEAAEELRKAEKARLRRMRGEEVDDEESAGARSRSKRRAPQADDLDDDLDIDGQTAAEVYGLGSGLGNAMVDDTADMDDEDDANDEESEDDDNEDGQDSSEGEQHPALEYEGYGEALAGDSEGEDKDVDHETLTTASRLSKTEGERKKKAASAKASADVPFTFACPATHDQFLSILEENSLQPSQVPLVVKRIRALFHPSLAEDNKFRLQAFLGVLLDHILFAAGEAAATPRSEERRAHLDMIDHLLKPIFELTKTYPIVASEHFVQKISLMEKNLTKGLSKGALRPEARTWPGAAELTLLRAAALVWPTSDQNHPVATPLALLSAHYLAHCRIRSQGDLASGLYLVSLVAHQQEEAKRMVPEALNFLQNALMILTPLDKKGKLVARQTCMDFAIPTPDFDEGHTKDLGLKSAGNGAELPQPARPDLFSLLASEAVCAEAAVSLLSITMTLIEEFATMYKGTAAYIELFQPFRVVLDSITPSTLPSKLVEQISALCVFLSTRLQEAQASRRPLRLHAHRAIPLASFIPKFDSSGGSRYSRFSSGSTSDPDQARAEESKLRALIKKERKGAIRELRKDSQFLAVERARERKAEEDEYKRKMGKIVSGLGEERSEQKMLEREKARLKKRAGGGGKK